MKKNKKYILFFLLIILFLIIIFINFFFKNSDISFYNNSLTYSQNISNQIRKHSTEIKTYEVLEKKKLKKEKIQQTTINSNIDSWKDTQVQKAGMGSVYAPFYSKHGWVSQIKEFSASEITTEIYNSSDESIFIDESFITFFGNNFDGYIAESEIIEGAGELSPGETRKVVVKGDGEARYFVIGQNYDVDDWILYRTITTNTIADDVSLPAIKDYEKYVIDSVPIVANFEEFNLLPYRTIFLNENKYQEIKISNKEKEQYPDSCIMAMEIDLFNKMDKDFIIDSISYIIKNSKNQNVENFTVDNYKDKLESGKRKTIYLPFKYLDGQYLYSIILNTNIGEVIIENPENIYGLIKKEI